MFAFIYKQFDFINDGFLVGNTTANTVGIVNYHPFTASPGILQPPAAANVLNYGFSGCPFFLNVEPIICNHLLVHENAEIFTPAKILNNAPNDDTRTFRVTSVLCYPLEYVSKYMSHFTGNSYIFN